MITIYIGLGSNLGDRAGNLQAARDKLASRRIRIMQESSLYETEPQDYIDQPWFLNQVVKAATDLAPRALLRCLLEVEREMGRERTMDKGPRIIDLDILLYGESIIQDDDLQIPHPRMTERRFVLEPLAELQPDLQLRIGTLEEHHAPIQDWLALVRDQQIRRLP